MTEPTICVECKHFLEAPLKSARKHKCLASPFELGRSWITGEWFEQNYEDCVHINTSGNCPKFEKKDD